ncbi:MAG: hypothetical protein IJO44_03120 [Clostridia bacterium]|nr:hypothetical protein [Clostridia bacterium]
MKRFSVFLLSVVLFFYAIDSYAMLQGDLDEDGSVTINDAICALRISAGIEYCDVNSPTFTSADVDGDKIISLSDARNLLLVATGISENIIDGIAVTNLPVTFDGITINSFSLSGNKVTINVKNNTGKAIQSLTTISYKCYNTNGTVLKTGSVFLEDMNSGENCNSYFYIEDGTTKVLFTDVDLCFGSYVAETQTSLINDMNVTTLPVTFDGITINSFSLSGNKVTINVKNNTGKAIQSLTTISYKCYNTNGTVLKTGSVFLEDMNSGENCNSYFYIEEGTTKVIFTDVDVCA